MFARWSQENFFRYMRQSYSLDGLIDYGPDDIRDTTEVVNPAYRTPDGQVRKTIGVLNRKAAPPVRATALLLSCHAMRQWCLSTAVASADVRTARI
jgi:transposase-like protein